MNSIPTTFNETLPSYTAVGGKERYSSTGLSAVILNRCGRYPRRTFFQELEKTGFDYVISIESSPERYDVEELSGRFPFVRFILLKREISLGEQINLAASELDSPLFFVLWNDLKIIAGGSAGRMAERLSGSQEDSKDSGEKKSPFKRLCTVPVIQNSRFETLPTLIAPVIFRKKIRTIFFEPHTENLPSLYPFDGIGIYDRERFIRLGGFDSTLKNTHWQFMDFGFRAHLWGEEIRLTQQTKLSCTGEIPAEDNTAESSYRRFYLKNLAPEFRGDCAHLPLRRFPGYLFKFGEDPFAAWEDFSESRRWVRTNRFRWRCDARSVTEQWNDAPAAKPLFSIQEN
ncbi:hypothetical protein AGMMS50293_24370 [Spirochaetia bacterium]|nr:hypothetical protein AGMMS50293_24370 [Spirochaetia bacterium]